MKNNKNNKKINFSRFITLIYLIYFGLISSASYSQTENVNIFIPPNETGGFGDLMTNIWMAQKIKAKSPDVNVSVYVDPSFKGPLKKIFDNSLHEDDVSKTINGITYHFPAVVPDEEIEGTFPKTCNVSFSMNAAQEYKGSAKSFMSKIKDDSLIIFDEYGYDHFDDDLPSFLSSVAVNVFGGYNQSLADKPRAVYRTGPSRSGLYINSSDLDPGSPSKEDTLSVVKQDIGIMRTFKLNTKNTMIGYSYTDQEDSALAYIRAMSQLAALPVNKDKKIILTVRSKAEWNLSSEAVPANLVINTFESMPFEKTQIYIGGSDLPTMLTGDMSATQALDKNKVFFYEELNHKSLFIGQLNKELSKTGSLGKNPVITYIPIKKSSDPRNLPPQQASFHYGKARKIIRKFNEKQVSDLSQAEKDEIDDDYMELTVKSMLRVLKNNNIQRKFQSAVSELRKDASLPDKFLDICDLAAAKKGASDYLPLVTASLRAQRKLAGKAKLAKGMVKAKDSIGNECSVRKANRSVALQMIKEKNLMKKILKLEKLKLKSNFSEHYGSSRSKRELPATKYPKLAKGTGQLGQVKYRR